MNTQKIESRDNPRLKLARKIRDGKEHQLVFIEGTRLAEEAVWSDIRIEFCLFEEHYTDDVRGDSLISSVLQKTVDVFELSRDVFSTVSDTVSSQGVIVIARRPDAGRSAFERALSDYSSAIPLVVMLNEINNPANLGAVIRTAEAAGAGGVIVSENSADVYSAKSLRGAMGSAFRIPIWARASITDVVNWRNSNRYSTIGASAAAERSYTDVDWAMPHLLIMGSEAHGIPHEIEEGLDEKVRILMDEKVESLNLAVATGVILFEARRQVSLNRSI